MPQSRFEGDEGFFLAFHVAWAKAKKAPLYHPKLWYDLLRLFCESQRAKPVKKAAS